MTDISLTWNALQAFADVSMDGASLATGNDLETAILVSLFTDAVADPSDLLPTDERADPRGWWADTYETDQIGSQLWQSFWRVRNQETLNWARDTSQRSLRWLIEDGIASAIDVMPTFYGSGGLALQVMITEASGRVSPYRFVWDQLASRISAPVQSSGGVSIRLVEPSPDVVATIYPFALSDALGATDIVDPNAALGHDSVTATDAFAATSTAVYAFDLSDALFVESDAALPAVHDLITASDTLTVSWSGPPETADTATASETLAFSWSGPPGVADTATATDSFTFIWLVHPGIVDPAIAMDTRTASWSVPQRGLADGATASDSIALGVGYVEIDLGSASTVADSRGNVWGLSETGGNGLATMNGVDNAESAYSDILVYVTATELIWIRNQETPTDWYYWTYNYEAPDPTGFWTGPFADPRV